MKNHLSFQRQWDFNNSGQTESAQHELKELFKRTSLEQKITSPQAMEQWCKEYDINYKTLSSWFKWKSNENCPIKEKQLIRIELAIRQTFNKGVTLTSLWALININNEHSEKDESKLLKIFLEADGFLIEFAWLEHQINTVGQNLKNANSSLENLMHSIKEYKKIKASPPSAKKSINELEQNIILGAEVKNFLSDMRKFNVTPHINWVAPIFNKEFDNKRVLMICLSAIPGLRPDVKPKDIIMTPDANKVTFF